MPVFSLPRLVSFFSIGSAKLHFLNGGQLSLNHGTLPSREVCNCFVGKKREMEVQNVGGQSGLPEIFVTEPF